MIARGKTLQNDVNNYKEWQKISIKSHHNSNENHYQYIEPNFFVEEYLGDDINDYKFFCFHGECKFFHVDFGRFNKRCRNVYDKKYNILDFNERGLKKCDFKVELPDNINTMIKIAEHLSKEFEFVRIDLYNINNKIYFSEFTFVPASGNTPFHPEKYEYEIGKYWK